MDTNKETNTVVDTKVWDGNFADFKNAVDDVWTNLIEAGGVDNPT